MLALAHLLLLLRLPPDPTPSAPGDPVLVGAGDIAACGTDGAARTAALVEQIPGTVFTLGDNAYPSGSPEQFERCYGPTWGRFRDRTRPAAGNHEYGTSGARGYFGYFGDAAGDPSRGYYAYDLGSWRVIVLNSNCSEIGGCGSGSRQETWLRQELATHTTPCAVAMWHHPRFSSASHGDSPAMADLWKALAEGGVDVALAGHDHVYERFAPLDGLGRLDAPRGIRSFTVGTGGRSHYAFQRIHKTSEVRNADTYGVLKLTLHLGAYDWEFVPVEGGAFHDSGSGRCH